MKSSIRNRLLVMLLVCIIVPYFISVLAIYFHTKEKVEQHEYQISEVQLQKGSEELGQYFQDMVNLPYILYLNPGLFRIFERGFDTEYTIHPSLVHLHKIKKITDHVEKDRRGVGQAIDSA
ncbi:hypothetical protein [Paenibacillus zanthoxyli]|uniref:hypothetical protein n=1 Tax=Paenibacillus zanthoxyli TaxID=369399 RepID=UPI00046FB067|nr:hypothetical protein [Paenibacillus zanthoxyli]